MNGPAPAFSPPTFPKTFNIERWPQMLNQAAAKAGVKLDDVKLFVCTQLNRRIIEAAYNDSERITELFNKNLLYRINAELGGRFDLAGFDHHAPFVESEPRIEMRLVSRQACSVHIAALDRDFHFRQGEFIHTENSHKYSLGGFSSISAAAGLGLQHVWTDDKEWFAVAMLKPEGASA